MDPTDPRDDAELVSAIAEARASKDEYFRTSPHSPIAPHDRAAFHGLAYYPVDPGYRFEGLTLDPYEGDGPEAFAIPTSDGDHRQAWRAGTFHFALGGQLLGLVAYDLGSGSLFVPFQDATSVVETYGAGRYLDIDPELDGSYTVDFNLAYFPLCAYSPDYSCPLTPAENRLPVRVAAGERLAPAPEADGPTA